MRVIMEWINGKKTNTGVMVMAVLVLAEQGGFIDPGGPWYKYGIIASSVLMAIGLVHKGEKGTRAISDVANILFTIWKSNALYGQQTIPFDDGDTKVEKINPSKLESATPFVPPVDRPSFIEPSDDLYNSKKT